MSPPVVDPSVAAVQDPGLQAERTRLAWSRTALALAVVGAVELHPTRPELSLLQRTPALLTMLLAVAYWVYGGRRYLRVRAALAASRPIVPRHSMLVLGALVVLPAATALWAVWI